MIASAAPSPHDNPTAWWVYFKATLAARTIFYSEGLASDVIACVRSGEVHPLLAGEDILKLLMTSGAFSELIAAGEARDTDKIAMLARSGAIASAFSNKLAQFLLANFLIASPAVELVLTQGRRALLVDLMHGVAPQPETGPFAAALAQHCFLTEYAYWEEPDETLSVEILTGNVEAMIEDGDTDTDLALTILGCYRALVPWPGDKPLTRSAIRFRREGFDEMWDRLVEDRLQEVEIARNLRTIGAIEDATSQAVRSQ